MYGKPAVYSCCMASILHSLGNVPPAPCSGRYSCARLAVVCVDSPCHTPNLPDTSRTTYIIEVSPPTVRDRKLFEQPTHRWGESEAQYQHAISPSQATWLDANCVIPHRIDQDLDVRKACITEVRQCARPYLIALVLSKLV